MKNEFEYQDSLDLFEEIYYTESGELKKEDWNDRSLNSNTYRNIGVSNEYNNEGESKIVGKSAFTPRIVKKPSAGRLGKDHNEYKYKYCLTIDNQGKFNDNSVFFYDNNMVNIKEIDITDMSKEDVLNEVKQMLTMSNEEIMKKFNIKDTYRPQVKLELLLDDIIQQYAIENGIEIESTSYGREYGISINTEDNRAIEQRRWMPDDDSEIIMEVLGQEEEYCCDRITYKLLSGRDEYDDIRIEIDLERTKVSSELGKKILDTLRDRFTEKQAEKDEVEQPVQESDGVVSEYNGEYDECSIDRLQNILKETEDSNRNKKIKIKQLEEKNDLIRKILEAKAKGKELDSRISELNNEFTTPEQ